MCVLTLQGKFGIKCGKFTANMSVGNLAQAHINHFVCVEFTQSECVCVVRKHRNNRADIQKVAVEDLKKQA